MSKHDHEWRHDLDAGVSLGEPGEALRGDEAQVRALLALLRDEARAPASLRVAVMREIESSRPSARERLIAWWVRPRIIRVSPAWGTLALAASLALFLLSPRGAPVVESSTASAADELRVTTRFVLVAPDASSVQVTGDFASWSPEGIEMVDIRGTGVWTVDVPLPAGVYQYTFIVNGTEWRQDPTAVSQVDDGFGQANSVVIVSRESEA